MTIPGRPIVLVTAVGKSLCAHLGHLLPCVRDKRRILPLGEEHVRTLWITDEMANDWSATLDFGADPNLAIGPEVETGNGHPCALDAGIRIRIRYLDFRRANDASGRAGIQRLVKLRLKSEVRLCRWRFDWEIHAYTRFLRNIDQLEF